MGQSTGHAEHEESPAARLGLVAGQIVEELGWDEDCDDDLRIDIEDVTGNELVDEDAGEVVDVVIQWWREDDGDLVDGLLSALSDLAPGGVVWLFTPKVGRPGHVDPSDIADAAPTAGLTTTTTVPVADDWSGTKLVAPKSVGR